MTNPNSTYCEKCGKEVILGGSGMCHDCWMIAHPEEKKQMEEYRAAKPARDAAHAAREQEDAKELEAKRISDNATVKSYNAKFPTRSCAGALREIKDGIIPGTRGIGCGTIVMADGREYTGCHESLPDVERYSESGELLERCDASKITGEVRCVRWSCDGSGAVYQ